MTKQEAIEWAGGSASQLAERLGITRQAISQWDDEAIPKLREMQIKIDKMLTEDWGDCNAA